MSQIVSTPYAPRPIDSGNQAIKIGKALFASGQIARDPLTGQIVGKTVVQQAEQVMKNLRAVLKAGGTDFSHLIKANCFLADMSDFAAFNAIYSQYVGTPVRSSVSTKELPKGALIEIEAVASLV